MKSKSSIVLKSRWGIKKNREVSQDLGWLNEAQLINILSNFVEASITSIIRDYRKWKSSIYLILSRNVRNSILPGLLHRQSVSRFSKCSQDQRNYFQESIKINGLIDRIIIGSRAIWREYFKLLESRREKREERERRKGENWQRERHIVWSESSSCRSIATRDFLYPARRILVSAHTSASRTGSTITVCLYLQGVPG